MNRRDRQPEGQQIWDPGDRVAHRRLKDFFHEWRGVGFAFDKFRAGQKDKAAKDLTQTIRRAAKVYWSHRRLGEDLVVQATK